MRARDRLLVMGVMLAVVSCGGDGGATATSVASDTETDASVATTAGDDTTTSVGATTTVVEVVATEDPCALATPEQVAEAFGATSASGEPLVSRACSYALEAGIAPTVEVYHFGASSGWDGVKAGYEENRGGVTDVDGVGDAAYNPNDMGPYELVVLSDDVIFAVGVTSGSGPEVEAAIVDLATTIAEG
jgi:hypothetical protein